MSKNSLQNPAESSGRYGGYSTSRRSSIDTRPVVMLLRIYRLDEDDVNRVIHIVVYSTTTSYSKGWWMETTEITG